MLRTCLTKMTAMMSLRGTSQQTAALLTAVTAGASRKRLGDRLPTEISAGQDMGMLERIESHGHCRVYCYTNLLYRVWIS